MAKNDIGGVWRTIGGRRVFIKDGQDLASAMRESGKFNTSKKDKDKLEQLAKESGQDLKKIEKETDELINENDYAVYKKAKLDPDSINPMTEHSTDWEALDKQYKDRFKKEGLELYKEKFEQYEKTTYNDKGQNIDGDKKLSQELRQIVKDYDLHGADTIPIQQDIVQKHDKIIANIQDKNRLEKDYNLSYRDEKGEWKKIKFSELKEKSKKEWQENQEKIKGMTDKLGIGEDNQKWLTEKDSNWLKKQGHDTELEKKIKNFKPSGDIDDDERRLEDISSNYFYDEVGIYNENIDSTATKWAHDKAVELNKKDSKPTNEIMNEKIRAKANKNTFKEDLPKRTEIKTQGTSNRKEVSENIQAHILDYYTEDYTGEKISPSEAFVRQMDAMGESNMWRAGQKIAEGGSYLIYNGDMADFLNELKINPKGKTFSDQKAFEMYTSLVGRESAKLYDRIKKNSYNKYMKEHPLSKMTFSEFKDMKEQ